MKQGLAVYSETKTLKTYQTDKNGFMRPVMLMNELQALADTNASLIGFGRNFCIEKNIAWVLTHFMIDIIDLPRDGDELTFETWPSGFAGLKATRDFIVRDKNGEIIIRATSQWVLIDMNSRRPLRLAENLPTTYTPDGVRAWDVPFEKFAEFESEKTQIFKCRYDDIDVNKHINNAVYATWATESVGHEFRDTHRLRGIEINFKKEIPEIISEIKIDTKIEDNTSHHKIYTDCDNAYIVCRWEKLRALSFPL